MRLRTLSDPDFLPALDERHALRKPAAGLAAGLQHPPRILLLYGSLRESSYSRFAIEEAARLARFFGAEPPIFDHSDLPLPDRVMGDDHPAVRELRELAMWSEGQIWCSPERHGQITGLMKAQIWRELPLLALWFVPSLIGLPFLMHALLRHPVVIGYDRLSSTPPISR